MIAKKANSHKLDLSMATLIPSEGAELREARDQLLAGYQNVLAERFHGAPLVAGADPLEDLHVLRMGRQAAFVQLQLHSRI